MIIDTMIAAYACFEVPGVSADSRAALRKARTLHTPDSFRAEFLNVAWQYARKYKISMIDLEAVVRDAYAIPTGYIACSILWRDALVLALDRKHSPYDTLFVAAAMRRKSKVLTCDKKLLRAFPAHTIHISDYIS